MRLQCKWECLTQLGMAYTELSIEYDNGVTICLNYVLVSGCSSLNATAETIAGVAELPYTRLGRIRIGLGPRNTGWLIISRFIGDISTLYHSSTHGGMAAC